MHCPTRVLSYLLRVKRITRPNTMIRARTHVPLPHSSPPSLPLSSFPCLSPSLPFPSSLHRSLPPSLQFCFVVCGKTVCRSCKQTALSSCKVKYISLCEAIREGRYIQTLCKFFGLDVETYDMFENNQSAIAVASKIQRQRGTSQSTLSVI